MMEQLSRDSARVEASAGARAMAVAAIALCALAPATAAAVSCEWAVRFATEIVDNAERAIASEDYIPARRAASDTRSIAIDVAREGKACGCPAVTPLMEQVAQQAIYAINAQNLTAARQYAAKIKEYGVAALDVLSKCPGT